MSVTINCYQAWIYDLSDIQHDDSQLSVTYGDIASFLQFDKDNSQLVIKQDAAPSWFAGNHEIKVLSQSLANDQVNSTVIDLEIFCP